jgi:hypothetical protein
MHLLRQLLRPNSGHPQGLGEHVVVPHCFPCRERGRLAGIRPAPPPPHAKALIPNPRIFLGCLAQTKGIVVMFQIFAGSLAQKGNFNSVALLLELVKSLENRKKFGKLRTQVC